MAIDPTSVWRIVSKPMKNTNEHIQHIDPRLCSQFIIMETVNEYNGLDIDMNYKLLLLFLHVCFMSMKLHKNWFQKPHNWPVLSSCALSSVFVFGEDK